MKKILSWIPSILCMIFIFKFSNEPANISDITSGGVCEMFLKIFYRDFENLSNNQQLDLIESIQFYIRKMAHFSIYATLGVCTSIGMIFQKVPTKKKITISLLICLIYSISDEIHQLFIEGRSCQFRDVCIDFTGAIIGTIIFYLILKVINHFRNKNKNIQ